MRRTGLTVLAVAALLALPGPGTAQQVLEVRRFEGEDRIATAVAVSSGTFAAADTVLLARADDPADALAGAPLAAVLRAPVLLTARDALDARVRAELDRLGAGSVLLLGGAGALDPAIEAELAGREVRRVGGEDRYATAAAIAAELPPGDRVVLAGDGPDAVVAGALAAVEGPQPVLLTAADALPPATIAALGELAPTTVTIVGGTRSVAQAVEDRLLADGIGVRRIAGSDRFGTASLARDSAVAAGADPAVVWLAAGHATADAVVASAAVAVSGGTLLLVEGGDLAAAVEPYRRLRESAATLRSVTLLGGPHAINAGAPQQLDGLLHGPELPGGGRVLLPHRRLVALYGNDRSAALGVLGEQPPDAAAARLAAVAEPYRAGDRAVLGAFELIATVATRAPGADGLYRAPSDPAFVQRYLDAARAHGLYLILDLQPGRSDFLTEARRYEEFLRQPDVGLALDPEWRMGPNQVPGDGVGQVSAAEVNAVLDYVAGLVAEELLPQKLVVVHQFQLRMVTDRDTLRAPPGLAVMIHMDGFGTHAQKLGTYAGRAGRAAVLERLQALLRRGRRPLRACGGSGDRPGP